MSHGQLATARIVMGCTMMALAYDGYVNAESSTSLSSRLDALVFARIRPEWLAAGRRATAVLLALGGLCIAVSALVQHSP